MDLCSDQAELIIAQMASRRYMKKLNQHPSCFDPEHPGCERCEDEEE